MSHGKNGKFCKPVCQQHSVNGQLTRDIISVVVIGLIAKLIKSIFAFLGRLPTLVARFHFHRDSQRHYTNTCICI